MNRLLSVLLLASLGAAPTIAADANAPPHLPQAVRSLPPDDAVVVKGPPAPGMTRLRVTVTSRENQADQGVRIGAVVACSADACWQADTSSSIDIDNTWQGRATHVVDMVVPPVAISSVHFLPASGQKLVAGRAALPTPMQLIYHGGEVSVALARDTTQPMTTYRPVATTTNLLGHIESSVYYDPRYATRVDLPLGTRLAIPEGALSGPQLFRVSVHKAGNAFPAVDIYPKVDLARPAELEVEQIIRPYQVPGYTGPEPIIRAPIKSSKIASYDQTGVPARYKTIIRHTGFLVIDPTDDTSEVGLRNSCAQQLAGRQSVLPEGVRLLNGCETAPPYVQIVTPT